MEKRFPFVVPVKALDQVVVLRTSSDCRNLIFDLCSYSMVRESAMLRILTNIGLYFTEYAELHESIRLRAEYLQRVFKTRKPTKEGRFKSHRPLMDEGITIRVTSDFRDRLYAICVQHDFDESTTLRIIAETGMSFTERPEFSGAFYLPDEKLKEFVVNFAKTKLKIKK